MHHINEERNERERERGKPHKKIDLKSKQFSCKHFAIALKWPLSAESHVQHLLLWLLGKAIACEESVESEKKVEEKENDNDEKKQ